MPTVRLTYSQRIGLQMPFGCEQVFMQGRRLASGEEKSFLAAG
jgi:hypothetical protein